MKKITIYTSKKTGTKSIVHGNFVNPEVQVMTFEQFHLFILTGYKQITTAVYSRSQIKMKVNINNSQSFFNKYSK